MPDQSFQDRLARINTGNADAIGQTLAREPAAPAYVAPQAQSYEQVFWMRIVNYALGGVFWMLPTTLAIRYFADIKLWFETSPSFEAQASNWTIGLGIAIAVSLLTFAFYAREAILTLGRSDGVPMSLILGGVAGAIAGLGPMLFMEIVKLAASG